MDKYAKISLPQAGTDAIGGGESRSATALCPTESGGGNALINVPGFSGVEKKRERRADASREKEKALEDYLLEVEESRRALGLDVGDPRTVDALCQQVSSDVESIIHVATRSSNLKGTFVKALKDAAASIKEAFEILKERSSSDEVRKLQAENARLRRDLDNTQTQVVEPRRGQPGARGCNPCTGQRRKQRGGTGLDSGVS